MDWLRPEDERDDDGSERERSSSLFIDPLVLARYAAPRPRRRFGKEFRLRLLGDLRGRRVLELGCGDGRDAVLLGKLGAARVLGIDTRPRAVALAERRALANGVADRVSFLCADAARTELPPNSFDVVWGSRVLHRLGEDLKPVLRNLVEWTRPGGLLLFAEPTALSPILRRLRAHLPAPTPPCHPERPLAPEDCQVLRRYLPDLRIRPFSLLGGLDRFLLPAHRYERAPTGRRTAVDALALCDWLLLSLPPLGPLGSFSVLYGTPRKLRSRAGANPRGARESIG